jgi:hypothetical protein
MNSLDHIEKLIQMTAIEQMYSLIQKMRTDMKTDMKTDTKTDMKTDTKTDMSVQTVVDTSHSNNELNERIQQLETQNNRLVKTVNELMLKINSFEAEFQNLQKTNSTPDNQLLRGQTLLTNYSGFMKNAVPQILEEPDSKTDIEHIRLKIEDCEVVHVADDNNTSILLEPKSDEPEYAPASDTESEVHTNEDVEEVEEVEEVEQEEVEEVEEVEEDEEEVEEVEQEEVEQEEVEEVEEEEVEEEEVEEEKEEQEQKEDEEVEEVFEIEIDDVTYFATDEENGILYAVTKDGDVGKKVGILRDGEPIFM